MEYHIKFNLEKQEIDFKRVKAELEFAVCFLLWINEYRVLDRTENKLNEIRIFR